MMASPCQFNRDWFAHPEWWFCKHCKYDTLITDTYGHLLLLPKTPVMTPLTSIIVYDQLPRHMYRNQLSNHIIDFYLQKALSVVNTYINTDYEKQLSAQEWTFFMLPLRHTKVARNILYVLDKTWQRLEEDPQNSDVYKRFLKATYTNALKILHHIECDPTSNTSFQNIQGFNDLLAFNPQEYIHHTSMKATHLVNVDFLSSIDTNKTIVVSLSGGVDSMVCSYVLKHLLSPQSPQTKVMAVHINYDNRPQCSMEVEFLKHWSKQLDIPLYIRTIKEIHRAPCMKHELRELYERYTRDVRYLSYKTLCDDKDFQVILGHNQDDSLENIMTNIAHRNKYDNLTGMSSISSQDDITFVRPLLNIPKQNIVEFAHSNNIPYLPNSTPSWSQRGQIRNTIVPCLDNWDTRFVPSMFELSNKMTSLYHLLHLSLSQFIAKGVFNETQKTFTIESLPINQMCTIDIFWKEFFLQVFKYCASAKSLVNLTDCIQKFQWKQDMLIRKVMISKELCFEMKKRNHQVLTLSVFIMKCPGPSMS
jgi:tRNA(Ile)-lysidine synthetase-like protein